MHLLGKRTGSLLERVPLGRGRQEAFISQLRGKYRDDYEILCIGLYSKTTQISCRGKSLIRNHENKIKMYSSKGWDEGWRVKETLREGER